MSRTAPDRHRFLFVQGPHGPFLRELAAALMARGASVTRVSLNGGDSGEWGEVGHHARYRGTLGDYPGFIADLLLRHEITDVLLYGDARSYHRATAAAARALGVTVHYIEEGYLRPHWITYEREGVNGNSPMLAVPDALIAALDDTTPLRAAPDQWGAMWGHLWHGLVYHARIWWRAARWRGYESHRGQRPLEDFKHAARALAVQPVRLLRRRWRDRALRLSGAPYHVVLLQLGHDASIRAHSRYEGMRPFMAEVADAFAKGAPGDHHLVFKAHPFDDGRDGLEGWMKTLETRHGLRGRVHFLQGERLAALLDSAESAVTVNSTAAQQALWRNLPVRAFGRAVYDRHGLVSRQPLPEFFARPERPDHRAYLAFRRAMLLTSQIPGGFYTRSGRRALMRTLPGALMAREDPYALLRTGAERGAEVTDRKVIHLHPSAR